MHVALNAQLLSFAPSYRQAGISRLIYNLLRGLHDHDGAPGDDLRYTVFANDAQAMAELSAPAMQVRVARLPAGRPPLRILWEQCALPIALGAERADLLHALAFVQPLLCPLPTVVTVYDLSFLIYPQAFNSLNRAYLSTMTPWSVRHARRVIAISESTKRDLVRLTGVPAERVRVIYPAVEDMFQPGAGGETISALRAKYSLPEKMILFIGTLEPRKNAETVVRAYDCLRRMGYTDYGLVLAGGAGWRYGGMQRAIDDLGLREHVVLPGYVPYSELPLWYAAADLFVYPSLYEGFGLPVLEALACGAPVITSTTSSLPEVAGEAALLVDPTDVDGLAEAMARILHDPALQEDLRQRGPRQAAHFRMQSMIEATIKVYEECRRGELTQ